MEYCISAVEPVFPITLLGGLKRTHLESNIRVKWWDVMGQCVKSSASGLWAHDGCTCWHSVMANARAQPLTIVAPACLPIGQETKVAEGNQDLVISFFDFNLKVHHSSQHFSRFFHQLFVWWGPPQDDCDSQSTCLGRRAALLSGISATSRSLSQTERLMRQVVGEPRPSTTDSQKPHRWQHRGTRIFAFCWGLVRREALGYIYCAWFYPVDPCGMILRFEPDLWSPIHPMFITISEVLVSNTAWHSLSRHDDPWRSYNFAGLGVQNWAPRPSALALSVAALHRSEQSPWWGTPLGYQMVGEQINQGLKHFHLCWNSRRREKNTSHTVNCSEYQLSWKYWCAHASSLPTSVIWKQQLYVLLPNNPLRLAWAGVQVRSSPSSEPIGCLLQNRSRIPASPDYSYIPDLVRASSRSRVPRLIINTDNPRDLWGIQHFWKDSCPGDEAVTARQLRPVRKLCISITPGRCKGSNCNMWGISSTSSLEIWLWNFMDQTLRLTSPQIFWQSHHAPGQLSWAKPRATLVW